MKKNNGGATMHPPKCERGFKKSKTFTLNMKGVVRGTGTHGMCLMKDATGFRSCVVEAFWGGFYSVGRTRDGIHIAPCHARHKEHTMRPNVPNNRKKMYMQHQLEMRCKM